LSRGGGESWDKVSKAKQHEINCSVIIRPSLVQWSANKISCSKDAATAGSSLQNARKNLKKAKRSCPLSMIPSKREKCLSNLSKVSDKMKEVNEQVIAMSEDCAGVSL